MKKHIALLVIVAAALMAVPPISRAEDKPVAAEQTAPAQKKKGLPFHGKIAAVDAAAATITVGKSTYNITADTKITKDGQPATLADITVGEKVGGAYKKDGEKRNATTINIGVKAKKAKKDKPAAE